MYEVFDFFLELDTWHTRHNNDLKVFDEALNKVIDNDNFDPSRMGDYFQDKVNNDAMSVAIQHYVDKAYAIQEFLKVTGR